MITAANICAVVRVLSATERCCIVRLTVAVDSECRGGYPARQLLTMAHNGSICLFVVPSIAFALAVPILGSLSILSILMASFPNPVLHNFG